MAELLLNILFILVSILLYHFFWMQKGKHRPHLNALIFLVICLATAFFCMTFAAEPHEGYRYDLRHIVLIISSLLGGPVASAIVWAFTNFYRFILGGDGVIPGLLASTFVYILLLVCYPRIKHAGIGKKVFFAAIASFMFTVIWIPFVVIRAELQDYILYIALYEACSILGAALTLYLIEALTSQAKMQEELANIEKFQLVGEMAASMSHEIRNPLTSTKGFLQLLQSEQCTEDERRLYLDIAMTSIEQVNNVLADYLTFAKPNIDKIELLHLHTELQHVIALATPMANSMSVEIDYTYPQQHIHINGEQHKLHQCLLNIMKNCIEAMPNGGTLAISLQSDDGTARIHMTDTGIGMDEEQLNRLGSPFYSTKEKGTGLGMMVVFSIIQAMQGHIHISSQMGIGTSFILSFPSHTKT